MRSSSSLLIPFLLLPISALDLTPFDEPYSVLSTNESLSSRPHHELLKRDGNCPINFNSCATYKDSYGGACCTAGSFCTTDRAHNIACCPTGARCTGSLEAGGGAVLGGTAAPTTTPAPVFGAPTTVTATTTSTTRAAYAGPVSYVANAYFPFPYIATTYANSAACNAAYQACQTNYAACTAALDGSGMGAGNGGFGVTIVAPNGGVTATATATPLNLGPASATSICSSLSAAGCYNIVSTNCAQFGTGAGTGNAAPRQTAAACYAVVAGLGLGLAGQLL